MPGEDQERFEDYLELEHYIEELQAGHVAHPPGDLTPEKANIYRMAALFRSASPEGTEPRPEFTAELRTRLEQELAHLQQPTKPQYRFPFLHKKPKLEKRSGVSRRALLAGGAAAAASLLMGAGIGAGVELATQQKQGTDWNTELVPKDIPTTWHFVTTLAALGSNALPFTANGVVGYVILDDGDDTGKASTYNTNSAAATPVDPDKGKVIAMSAACTHMGCIVQWQSSDRKYHCPCHGGRFTEYGKADNGAGRLKYLADLPRLTTMIDNDGNIFVQVPLQSGSPTWTLEEEMTREF